MDNIKYSPSLSTFNAPITTHLLLKNNNELISHADAVRRIIDQEKEIQIGTPIDSEIKRFKPLIALDWQILLFWWDQTGVPRNDHQILGHTPAQLTNRGISLRSSLWFLDIHRRNEPNGVRLSRNIIKADEKVVLDYNNTPPTPRLRLQGSVNRILDENLILNVPYLNISDDLELRIQFYDAKRGVTFPMFFSSTTDPLQATLTGWPILFNQLNGTYSPKDLGIISSLAVVPPKPQTIGSPGLTLVEGHRIKALNIKTTRTPFTFPKETDNKFS